MIPKHASAPIEALVITDPRPREIKVLKWDQYPDDPPFKVSAPVGAVGMDWWANSRIVE